MIEAHEICEPTQNKLTGAVAVPNAHAFVGQVLAVGVTPHKPQQLLQNLPDKNQHVYHDWLIKFKKHFEVLSFEF